MMSVHPSKGMVCRASRHARTAVVEARHARTAARRAWYTRDIAGQEMPATYYDENYKKDREDPLSESLYQAQYQKSWRKVLSLIAEDETIADFGCGPGQFAQMAIAAKKRYVCGIDFSSEAIAWARSKNPNHSHCFYVGDLRDASVYPMVYDVAVCLETLEHIEDDLFVLSNFREGCRVVISVPSFALSVHVRHFKTAVEVFDRYRGLLNIHEVYPVHITPYRTLWIVDGVKRRDTLKEYDQ